MNINNLCKTYVLINVSLDYLLFSINIEEATINSVDNFIADTSQGMYAICNVSSLGGTAFQSLVDDITLIPFRQDTKGECSCCEDPATKVLRSLIGKRVEIEFLAPAGDTIHRGTVTKVGEGIVILSQFGSATSTCKITRITEL